MSPRNSSSPARTAFAAVLVLAGAALVTGWPQAAPAAAHHRTAGVRIEHPGARPTSAGAPVAGGYLTIVNSGAKADRLLDVSSPRADRVELHRMSLDGGIMRMRPVPEGLEIPSGKTVSLAPGGYHLMIFGPKQALAIGDRFPVILRFATAGKVAVDLVTENPVSNGGKL